MKKNAETEKGCFENQQFMKTITAEVQAVIFALDNKGVFTFSDGKGLQKLGLKPGQVVGISVYEVYKDYPEIIEAAQKSLNGQLVKTDSLEVGSLKFDTIFQPIFDENKKVIRVVGLAIDVTETKKVEEALREAQDNLERKVLERTKELARSKQLLEETGNLARIGGWELDLADNKLTWTDMVYKIHEVDPGFQPDLESGINFYAPEVVPLISEAVRLCCLEGKPWDLELPLITAKQNRLWVRAIGRSFWEEGKIVRIGGVFQDITEQKKAEEELIKYHDHLEELVKDRTAKLESQISDREKAENDIRIKNEKLIEVNAEKDKFFSIIAHDLKSPFNTLLGYAGLLADSVHHFTLDEIQDMADNLYDSAGNLFKLLENLLEWSRMKRGLVTFKPTRCDLFEVVNQNMVLYALQANRKKILVTNSIPSGTVVNADLQMLNTIIRNLLTNAIKFSPHDGSVIFGSKIMDEKTLEVFISDTGIGIPDEMKDNLFVLGAESSRKGTDDEPSSGLGLLLCKEYIEMHDGIFRVESEEGKGSTFSFTIPYFS